MPFQLLQGDLVRMHTDAIVNAANPKLSPGGGVCGAIFAAAGMERMTAACEQLGGCAQGDAVITPGFDLPARYVIHAVGPVWRGGQQGEAEQLAACYQRALALAQAQGLHSVAFPLISAGLYGYPREDAFQVAVRAIGAFLREQGEQEDLEVTLVLWEQEPIPLPQAWRRALHAEPAAPVPCEPEPEDPQQQILQGLMAQLRGFQSAGTMRSLVGMPPLAPRPREARPAPTPDDSDPALHARLRQLEPPFGATVLQLIDQSGRSDVQVYKRANLDRKLFSKLRSDPEYRPSKRTAVALCVALELSLADTQMLLARAGYTLSASSRADQIITYYIEQRNFDLFELNATLFAFHEPHLGA